MAALTKPVHLLAAHSYSVVPAYFSSTRMTWQAVPPTFSVKWLCPCMNTGSLGFTGRPSFTYKTPKTVARAWVGLTSRAKGSLKIPLRLVNTFLNHSAIKNPLHNRVDTSRIRYLKFCFVEASLPGRGDRITDRTIRQALERDRTIDITTRGRKTGLPRRIEIWFHNLDGRLYITGAPGSRGWYANIKAHAQLTFHLKHTVQADIPAKARPIEEDGERRRVMEAILRRLESLEDLEERLRESPLIEVELQAD